MAKLYFRYAAMKSGKSAEIIQINDNYNFIGRKGLLLIPEADETSDGNISSRIGLSIPATKISTEDNLFELTAERMKNEDISYVILDEANFITYEQANQLGDIVDFLNIDVLAYGLLTDFTSDLFGLANNLKGADNKDNPNQTSSKISGIARLVAIQDELNETTIKSLCHCGKKANFNARIVNNTLVTDGESIVLDSKNEGENHIQYVPLCRKCFKLKKWSRDIL